MTEASFLHATRESYDRLALSKQDLILNGPDLTPVHRALLGAFAESVQSTGNSTVADIGCGAGFMTRALCDLGTDAFGVDLSPEMVALAGRTYPDLRFEVGSMLDLEIATTSLGGVLAHYSIIHVPWDLRPTVFAEFHRVLGPGGQLMLVFQIGDDHRHRDDVEGVPVNLDWYRQQPDDVTDLLQQAGFAVRVRTVREPEGVEKVPQGYLLATKLE